jgi:nuclear pore complex protein Nup107
LSYTLFAFVRAGNIEDAVKLCRDAHQPWRAASIRGSLLFSWPAICEFLCSLLRLEA